MKHIVVIADVITEIEDAPDLSLDMCGLPSHVTEDQANATVHALYTEAREAYALGTLPGRKRARNLLYKVSQARGVYGLGSGGVIYPKK